MRTITIVWKAVEEALTTPAGFASIDTFIRKSGHAVALNVADQLRGLVQHSVMVYVYIECRTSRLSPEASQVRANAAVASVRKAMGYTDLRRPR